jgi:glc operon protein GlcG
MRTLPICIVAVMTVLPTLAAERPVLLARSRAQAPAASSPRPQSIDVVTARRVLAAAIARATTATVRVSVAVVDVNGDLVAFERMDGAVSPSILISQGKAHAALMFGMSTAELQDAIAAGRPVTATITPPPPAQMVVFPSRGGVPIRRDGRIIAAVGVAGVGPEIEDVIASAGADAAAR